MFWKWCGEYMKGISCDHDCVRWLLDAGVLGSSLERWCERLEGLGGRFVWSLDDSSLWVEVRSTRSAQTELPRWVIAVDVEV